MLRRGEPVGDDPRELRGGHPAVGRSHEVRQSLLAEGGERGAVALQDSLERWLLPQRGIGLGHLGSPVENEAA